VQVWKEELNRNGAVEDAVDVIERALHWGVCTDSPPATLPAVATADPPVTASDVRAAQAVVIAAAALVACMVLAQQAGSEEVCQGNQWRAARAGVVEVRAITPVCAARPRRG
jgi:hypothetical protein